MEVQFSNLHVATQEEIDRARASVVPVLRGQQRQGDVLFTPTHADPPAGLHCRLREDRERPIHGVDNLHVVTSMGRSSVWIPGAGQNLGTLLVPHGAVVFVHHRGPTAHHAPLAIGPGAYRVTAARTYIDRTTYRITGED